VPQRERAELISGQPKHQESEHGEDSSHDEAEPPRFEDRGAQWVQHGLHR
jgi:hypothetical protein